MSTRVQKVAQAIKKEVSQILQQEMNDPRIGFVTVTRIDLTNDLRYAKIYFSVLGNDKAIQNAQKGIENAKGFIRKLLGERLDLRLVPEINFKLDKSIEYSVHISQEIEKLKQKNES